MQLYLVLSLIINLRGKYTEALQTVLRNAPLGSRNQQVKVSLNFIFLTLKGFFFTRIEKIEYF